MWGILVILLENFNIENFFLKNLTLAHRQTISFWMRLSIPSKTHPTAKQLWSSYEQETREGKKVIFGLYFGIFQVLLLNFTDIFAATFNTSYFKIIPKKSFDVSLVSRSKIWINSDNLFQIYWLISDEIFGNFIPNFKT